jgi:hypothetical protein
MPREYCVGAKPKPVDFVGFFDGSQLNPRQENQEGLFMVPSRIDLDVEKWLHKYLSPNKTIKPHNAAWVEFVFPNQTTTYYECVQQMLQAGMTAKRLFPGLEGICESMKYSWFLSPKNLKTADR